MRQRGAVGGVLRVVTGMAVAILTLAACGSSGAKSASTTPTHPTPTTSTIASTSTTAPFDPTVANTVAQFKLTAALNAAKSIYDHTYDFTAVTPASLTPLVPNVQFVSLDQASKHTIGVLAQDKHDVLLATKSASGRWFCITNNDTDGVSYGVGASLQDVNSNGQCQLSAWPTSGLPTPRAGASTP
jgi:hypothetical protein